MSTRNTIDTIMRELIALDPTFVEKEADVRALISLLSEGKPVVSIDETFVQNLRTRLVVPHTFPLRSPYHRMNWWAVHLVPIGVIGILLFILMPSRLHYFEGETALPEETPTPESLRVNVSNDTQFGGAPSAKFAPQSSGVQEDTSNSYTITEQALNVPPPLPDRFEFDVQQPGALLRVTSVTLTQPGYVVIHTFGREGIGPIVGVSPLQNSGTTVGVPVYLRTVTQRGESYYATLYHDSGNGVFSLSDDIPVINPSLGTPVSATLTIGTPPSR